MQGLIKRTLRERKGEGVVIEFAGECLGTVILTRCNQNGLTFLHRMLMVFHIHQAAALENDMQLIICVVVPVAAPGVSIEMHAIRLPQQQLVRTQL